LQIICKTLAGGLGALAGEATLHGREKPADPADPSSSDEFLFSNRIYPNHPLPPPPFRPPPSNNTAATLCARYYNNMFSRFNDMRLPLADWKI